MIYIKSFGFEPLRAEIGLVGLVAVAAAAFQIVPLIPIYELKFILPLYMLLLVTMIWRSLARALHSNSNLPQYIGALGSLSFGVSDLVLCFHTFITTVPNGNFIILITYYFAQFGIAISVLNWKSNSKNKQK